MKLKEIILKYALQNAVKFNGRANPGAIVGKLLKEDGGLKSKLKELSLDIQKTVNESKGGKITYRADKFGNILIGVGKVSFDSEKLVDNLTAVLDRIKKIKPATVKGIYMNNVAISSSMGPGVKIEV